MMLWSQPGTGSCLRRGVQGQIQSGHRRWRLRLGRRPHQQWDGSRFGLGPRSFPDGQALLARGKLIDLRRTSGQNRDARSFSCSWPRRGRNRRSASHQHQKAQHQQFPHLVEDSRSGRGLLGLRATDRSSSRVLRTKRLGGMGFSALCNQIPTEMAARYARVQPEIRRMDRSNCKAGWSDLEPQVLQALNNTGRLRRFVVAASLVFGALSLSTMMMSQNGWFPQDETGIVGIWFMVGELLVCATASVLFFLHTRPHFVKCPACLGRLGSADRGAVGHLELLLTTRRCPRCGHDFGQAGSLPNG